MTTSGNALLRSDAIAKDFPVRKSALFGKKEILRAVDRIDLEIYSNETVILIGESGCGKTTLGKLFLKLLTPTAGAIYFKGKNLFNMSTRETMSFRKQAQMIFQDPFSSLNPRKTVEQILSRPFLLHENLPKEVIRSKVMRMLESVELVPELTMKKYPHQLSGGMRQRVVIARAIATKPLFVVADEPTSALDVSIRSSILDLMKQVQQELGLSYLFITHDFSVAHFMGDRIVVMYYGRIVEIAGKDILLEPLHPYTQLLLSVMPVPDPTNRVMIQSPVAGATPSFEHVTQGCRYRSRCPYAMEICKTTEPTLREVRKNHFVACEMY